MAGISIGIGIHRRKGGWTAPLITALSAITTSNTEQTITATIENSDYDGISFEYSIDEMVTWTVKGTSVNNILSATGLTVDKCYDWRARPYKGTVFGEYSPVAYDFIFNSTKHVGVWDHSISSTIIKSGANITSWNEATGNGRNLDIKAGSTTDSLDGVVSALDQTIGDDFNYNLPASIYYIVKLNDINNFNRGFFSAKTYLRTLFHHISVAGKVQLYPREYQNGDYPDDITTFHLCTCIFDGTSSELLIDENSLVPVFNWETNTENPDGFYISLLAQTVKYIRIRTGHDTVDNIKQINYYLKKKLSL